ncbi:MAG: methyltransferase domain-containing protein [Gemmatimonadetes bacterium]|nr:methyltransferase domain-containing protein [Gemmatimonadota bacterium]
MKYHGIDIVCPACRADLELRGDWRDGDLRCSACQRRYPILAGIPDLRLWPDPYIGFEQDRLKGLMLDEHCDALDFAAAVRFYYNVTEKVPPFQATRFARSLMVAAARARHSLETWETAAPEATRGMALLEIGCGTAALLISAAGRYGSVVGIDVAFRWLVLARRRLKDAGVEAPLLCACAEALPFPDRSFDRIVADSTIEHVRDAHATLDECARVARAGAGLFVATPNRFSLGPDPHAGLPAGGYLPDAVIAAYVRVKGGIPPRRRLWSGRGLHRALERHGFSIVQLGAPVIPRAQLEGFGRVARAGASVYNLVRRVPPGRLLLDRIGPLIHAVAKRRADDPTGASAGAPVARGEVR